jgi:PAS domain S-box-containing protein
MQTKTKPQLMNELEAAEKTIAGLEKQLATCKEEESEERFRSLFEHAPVAYQSLDEQGCFIDVNPAHCKMMGYPANELIGRSFGDLWSPTTSSSFPQAFDFLKRENQAQADLQLVRRDGTVIEVVLDGSVQRDEQGHFIRTHCILHDLTERKHAENAVRESEKRFTTLFHSNSIAIGITRKPGLEIVEVNDAWCKLTGYTREQAIGHTSIELGLSNPETLSQIRGILETHGAIHDFDIPLYTRTHQERRVLLSSEPIELGGESCVLTNLLDITERKQAEIQRESILEKVRGSEALLRQVLESTQDAIFAVDRDYRLLINNERHQQVLVETGGHPFHIGESVLPPDYLPEVLEHWRSLYDRAFSGEEFKWEAEWTYTDGLLHVNESNFSPLHDVTGNIIGALVVIRGITERKRAEQKIRESEERFSKIFQASPIGIVLTQIESGDILDVNDAFLEIFERKREEVIGNTTLALNFYPDPGDRARLMSILREQGRISGEETGFRRSLGEIGTLYVSAEIIDLPNGQALLSMMVDITKRKQAEAALKAERLRFEQVAATVPGAITVLSLQTDREMNLLYASKSFEDIFGLALADLSKNVGDIIQRVPKEEIQRILDKLQKMSVSLTPLHIEFPYQHPSKGEVWLENHAQPVREADGSVTWYGVTNDITERKQAENALERTRNTLEQAQKIAHMGSFEYIAATQTTVWSEEEYRIYGLDATKPSPAYTEMIQKMIHPDDAYQLHDMFTKAIERSSTYELEHRIVQPDGSVRWVYDRAHPYFNEQGKLERYIGTTLDITERKQAEETLKESEERFSKAFFTSPLSQSIIAQGTSEIVEVNEACCSLFEYSREELIGAHTSKLNLWEDPADRQSAVEELQRTGHLPPREATIRVKSGGVRTVIAAIEPIFWKGVPCLISFVIDITERKQVEQDLRESEQRFATIFENSPVAIGLSRLRDGQVIHVNSAFTNLYGFTREEIIGRTATELRIWAKPAERQLFVEALKTRQHIAGMEATARQKSGAERQIMVWGELVEINGEPCMMAQIIDIHERKLAEESIHTNSQKLELLLDLLPVGLAVLDSEGKIVKQNTALETILGISADSQAHGNYRRRQYLRPDGTSMPPEEFASTRVRRGEPAALNVETGVVKEDGATIWVNVSATRVPLNDWHTVVVTSDITERKQAEGKLRESEEKYRGLMESMDSVVATIDGNGKFLYMNDVAARQLGGTPQELIGKTIHELFPEPAASQQLEGVRQVIREDKGRTSESLSFVHGGPRWYHNSLQPIHNEHGQAVYALLNSTDIHELKAAQQELAELNRTLEERIQQATAEVQDLYNNAPAGYHSLDANGCFIQINQTELNWLGYSRDEVIGHSFSDFVTSKSLAVFKQNFQSFKQRGWLQDLEMEFLRKDGTTFRALVNATAIKDKNGNYVMSRSTVFDITERKLAESQREAALEKLRESYDQITVANMALEKAMRVKDEFLASMSHELRTPLTGILGLSESMLLGTYDELNDRQKKSLKFIHESGQHLLSLINDILDLSKIEAGRLEVELQPCSLMDVCQSSLQLTKGMANQKRQQVKFTPPSEPIMLNVDVRRLKQIIVNLLGNAIKFTPEKGELGLDVEPDEAKQQVKLIVWDKGIGIKPEHLPKLFQPFTQIDSSLAREYSGTGLGLSLVQRLVQLHNGSVEVESVFGEGSRFIVTLPWMAPPTRAIDLEQKEEPQVDPVEDVHPGQLILIVDDNRMLLSVLADFLESQNYRTIKIHSGRELLAGISNLRPDLILMDVQMPGMDGLETIRRIRAEQNSAIATTPIIAVTALVMTGDRERCLEAGANEYISKPMNFEKLVAVIRSLAGKKQ